MEELHLQRPTFMGAPQRGFLDPQVLLEAFWKKPQKVAFHKYAKKHFHYSWQHFSASVRTENIYVGLEHFQYQLKLFSTRSETIPD